MGRSKNATTKALIIIAMVGIGLPSVLSAKEIDCDMSVTSSIQILQEAPRIESRQIGEGGEKSKIFCAFAKLSGAKDPALLFQKVFDGAKTEPGKLYCLIWYYTNRRDLYEIKKTTLNQNAKITLIQGCIVSTFTVKTLILRIEDGQLPQWLGIASPQ
jgi:hypothetical protein